MGLKPSGKTTLEVSVAMTALATVSVILRFIGKVRVRQSFGAEDAFILLALLIFYAYIFLVLYGMYNCGGTMNLWEVTSLAEVAIYLKYLYGAAILMVCQLTAVKLSILLWYRRIFVIEEMKIPLRIVAGLVVLAFIINAPILIFECTPISAVWNLQLAQTAKCIPFGQMILGYEILNIILDIMILALPMMILRKLHISTARKIAVGAIFSLGAFVIVTSLLRIIYLYKPKDAQRVDTYRAMLWSTIELSVAILSACLPTLRPLLPRDSLMLSSIRSWFSGTFRRSSKERSYGEKIEEPIDLDIRPKKRWPEVSTHAESRTDSQDAEGSERV